MSEPTDGLVADSRGWWNRRKLPYGQNPNQRFEELFHKAKTARLPFDKECWLNIAFFLGEQYT